MYMLYRVYIIYINYRYSTNVSMSPCLGNLWSSLEAMKLMGLQDLARYLAETCQVGMIERMPPN